MFGFTGNIIEGVLIPVEEFVCMLHVSEVRKTSSVPGRVWVNK